MLPTSVNLMAVGMGLLLAHQPRNLALTTIHNFQI